MAIAVLLTPRGMGAIAVVRVAGEGSRTVVAGLAGAKGERAAKMAAGETLRAELFGGEDALDDALVVCAGPGEWELHVHGGTAVVEAVMAALGAAGARVMSAAEAREAEGGGIAADVKLALPEAVTMTGARLVAVQMEGGLSAWAAEWRRRAAGGEALWKLHAAAQWVLARSGDLQRLLRPARVALVGAPNAGKSTLANALLGRTMAITSEVAGTTRDWVDGETTFAHGGAAAPVILVDTAGVRATDDALERASIERTHAQAAGADVVVLVVDAAAAGGAAGVRVAADVVAVNKRDLVAELPVVDFDGPVVGVSAQRQEGLGELMGAVLEQLGLGEVGAAEAFAFAGRQQSLLRGLAMAETARKALELLEALVET